MKPKTTDLDDMSVLKSNVQDIEILSSCNKELYSQMANLLGMFQSRAYVLGYRRGLREGKAAQETEKPEC